jgi:hypothetical protein
LHACSGISQSAQTGGTVTKQRLGLVGNRFKPLTYDEMTPVQKTMIDDLLDGERQNPGARITCCRAARKWAFWRTSSAPPCGSMPRFRRVSAREVNISPREETDFLIP